MGNLKLLEVPISDILCTLCKKDAPIKYETHTPYILYDVVIDDDDDLPLTVTLDIKKIEWQRLSSGEYIAKANILVDCPCCRNPQILKRTMEAPVILIESLKKCRSCGQFLKFNDENIQYLETLDGKPSLSIEGKLSCHACAKKEQVDLNHKLPDNFWQKDSLSIPIMSTSNTDNLIVDKSKSIDMIENYIDFDLHISPDGYAVANSVEGQASTKISTTVPNNIRLSLKLIENRAEDENLLKEFGQLLYNWLFPIEIHAHFQQTEAVARREKAKIRLRLRVEAEEIASLPLEFIYRNLGGYFLSINPNTVFSRYLNLPLPAERILSDNLPPHVLAIISDPTDQVRLPVDEWELILEEALSKPLKNGLITLQTLKSATRNEIRNALLQQTPDIIQFVGHGVYKNSKGYIALVDDKTSKTWLVDDEQFANIFMGYDDHLRLISLATCESAKSDNPQGFSGIAPKLVQRGVPAVLSMQYQVYIKTAKIFLEDFYTAIAARKPIDWATQSARKAISLEFGLSNREFATPVLYMRARDGKVL